MRCGIAAASRGRAISIGNGRPSDPSTRHQLVTAEMPAFPPFSDELTSMTGITKNVHMHARTHACMAVHLREPVTSSPRHQKRAILRVLVPENPSPWADAARVRTDRAARYRVTLRRLDLPHRLPFAQKTVQRMRFDLSGLIPRNQTAPQNCQSYPKSGARRSSVQAGSRARWHPKPFPVVDVRRQATGRRRSTCGQFRRAVRRVS
jgi:hypothetical protein